MIAVAILAGLLAAVALRLLARRRAKAANRLMFSPLGGMGGDFISPYRTPGRGRSGKGF